MRSLVVAALAALTAASPAPRTPQPSGPQTIVRRAVAAMGGEQLLRGLSGVTIEFNAASFGLGQEETPTAQPRVTLSWGRIVTDYRGNRRAITQEQRQPTGVTLRQRQVVAGSIGMNENNGVQTAAAPAAVAGVLAGMRLQPDRVLLRALDDPASLTRAPVKLWRGVPMEGVRFAQGADTVSLYFDPGSGLLALSEIITDDPILGDRHAVTWYSRWQGAGLKLPWQYDSETNGRLLSHNLVTSLTANFGAPMAAGIMADSVFTIPDSIARRAQPATTAATPITVTLVELAPGVWRAEGQTHHSLVVDQGTQLVVVEAPQSSARFNAVLDTLKSRFPGKRIGLVASTHHHWDHSGGLRAAMAAGLPIAAHRRNVAFVRGIATAPKTVRPDALSRRQAVPIIRAVGDSLVVGTGERRVVLYALPTLHADGMLAAYLPGARILFASDVVSPPVPPATTPLPALGSGELMALVKATGITVDRYAGGHGAAVAWAEIERAATPR